MGNSKEDFVKIDLYYTDDFIFDIVSKDTIKMTSENEIIYYFEVQQKKRFLGFVLLS